MAQASLYRLWILRLVPSVPGGRWLAAAMLFVVLAGLFLWVASAASDLGPNDQIPNWSVSLFFCLILAYVPPTFHLVTERTEAAFDALLPKLDLLPAEQARLRRQIGHKSVTWMLFNLAGGFALYLLQSLVLSGGWQRMIDFALAGPVEFAGAVGPLPVWLFMTCCLYALVDNARLFRSLSRRVPIDIHDPGALLPFGSMAVGSVLLIVGAQALFPVMWLGGEISPWTTIPGLLATSVPLVYLVVAPIWPLHRRLQLAKRAAIGTVQAQINQVTAEQPARIETLTPLLAYRRELTATSEWPLSLGLLSQLGFYLIIVPITWVGAALIEILVDLFIAG